ncbi:MAG: DUF1844 domain-containing protein [Candidatus Omnitrophota bacterium]|nr:DUF1844 domain-containing protein [Candidatus Omnitrophota bacterium]
MADVKDNGAGKREIPQAGFGIFLSGLAMEAFIALGDIENPFTKKKDANLDHAKFIIDTLGMLKEKTKNNLSKEEEEALDTFLCDLRLKYVNKTQALPKG